jgi:hypothetical protein
MWFDGPSRRTLSGMELELTMAASCADLFMTFMATPHYQRGPLSGVVADCLDDHADEFAEREAMARLVEYLRDQYRRDGTNRVQPHLV